MAKRETLRKVLGFVIWLTGVIVSLAVAFGMIKEVLTIPFVPQLGIIAGWIVIITTILGIVLALIDYFS